MVPGAPLDDAPVRDERPGRTGCCANWAARFRLLVLRRFALLVFGDTPVELPALPVPLDVRRDQGAGQCRGRRRDLVDVEGHVARRATTRRPGTVYLLRPDQHVAARWRALRRSRRASRAAPRPGPALNREEHLP